jgi:hypothetical protein
MDLQPAAMSFLQRRRRQHDFQYAVFHVRLRVLDIDAVRQRNGAIETTVRPLESAKSFLLAFFLFVAFALNRKHAIANFDIDVFPVHTRQVRQYNQISVLLPDIDLRRPRATRGGSRADRCGCEIALEEGIEQPVHFVRKLVHERQWIVTP